ncbi:MAG: glycine cleavage system protein T, partial [Actinomycetota bacterium]
MTAAADRRSPLDDRHRALGARMVPFGGWEMPLQYSGVIEEHRTCRDDAVVFDVSHLGTIECSGPGAVPLLQWLLTNDLTRIAPGRAQYTHLLAADDAHVVDDIIVWWVDTERFLVMPNASNTARILAAFADADRRIGGAVPFGDITAGRAVLAVQGPRARERLAAVIPEAATVARFTVAEVGDLIVAGTGYTGVDGVEIHVPAAGAGVLWNRLLDAGITPAGLGA